MTAFGTLEQLLICKRVDKPSVEKGKAGKGKGKGKKDKKEVKDKPKRQWLRS